MKIGEKIRKLRQAKKMTLLDLATAIDSDVGNLSRLERGKQGYSDSILNKIAEALSVPVAELFSSNDVLGTVNKVSPNSQTDSKESGMYKVDVLDVSASAGFGSAINDVIEVIRSIEYTARYANTIFGGRPEGSVALINVRGDSMEGTIESGDLIFVDTNITFFDGDGIYVFYFNGDLYVKRLQKVKFELKVISDNNRYETWSITKDECKMLHIEGKVLVSQSQQIRRHG
ncbi:transcriptional regulator [Photorhabdus luminescens]|uniref:XRE family transcriptional regulator n=1 Tax=Photorhabdus luminescens TaxID=29488 RepID=UPI000B4D06DD|nr:helix-turn-helix transcriptional regulator [Photorhabdus luminescens]OWO86982.1 transcriptional regulator [Photorhabdus luminescens]